MKTALTLTLSTVLLCTLAACQTTRSYRTPRIAPVDNDALDAVTWDRLERFSGPREFDSYREEVRRLAKRHGAGWASRTVLLASNCDPAEDEDCLPGGEDEIVVTASSRVATPSSSAADTSITNIQNAGVDEGDIVKRVGDHLVVLQDGRLFSVDIGGGRMALSDRIDVYSDPKIDTWYDELLVFGDRLLVTGYSYGRDASELASFRIDDRGRFTRDASFLLSSDDYYDTDNYATRLVDGELVLYLPIALDGLDADDPVPWPRMVRVGADGRTPEADSAPALLRARDVHKPIQRTIEPMVHIVTRCDLGLTTATSADAPLGCESEAVVGPPGVEWYVSRSDAFLWLSPGWDDLESQTSDDDCEADGTFRDRPDSALFRVPHSGRAVSAARVKGRPFDQFSLQARDDRLQALVSWNRSDCDSVGDRIPARFVSIPFDSVTRSARALSERRYTPLPEVGGRYLVNRFTDSHLVYASRQYSGRYVGEENPGTAVVLDETAPDAARVLPLDFGALRAERVGDDVVLTGHRRESGLYMSMIDTAFAGMGPRITDTLLIPGRYESEGRSHAFNARVEPDGSALMGLPTSRRVKDARRNWWRSVGSDLSFIGADAGGALTSLGALDGPDNDDGSADGYECEVSCTDWYGNTRPIFTDGRVFGLLGHTLTEARVEAGTVRPVRSITISAELPGR